MSSRISANQDISSDMDQRSRDNGALQRHHHSLAELRDRAISFLHSNPVDWSHSQRSACKTLVDLYHSESFLPIMDGYERVEANDMVKINLTIDKIFFDDGLQDVVFIWHNDKGTWRHGEGATAISGRMEDGKSEAIAFNLSHPLWQNLSVYCTPWKVIETLAHECIHVFFLRFARLGLEEEIGFHHSAW
jgi:hypothetical protein